MEHDIGPGSLRPVAFPQVAAPDFTFWTTTGAQALVQGSVRANPNGSLTVGCYLYDVFAKTLMVQQDTKPTIQPGDPGSSVLNRVEYGDRG